MSINDLFFYLFATEMIEIWLRMQTGRHILQFLGEKVNKQKAGMLFFRQLHLKLWTKNTKNILDLTFDCCHTYFYWNAVNSNKKYKIRTL